MELKESSHLLRELVNDDPVTDDDIMLVVSTRYGIYQLFANN